ncbi:PREDICTED: protein amalgam-like [Polistes dominula]|uniref:Protein amalgam-like n=1 Tax=Polistes dominula TaxID=743375 RepID=A0ABM1JD93_POLDO|nr:PREDICTED: protein amalgam-like [Polistes dominula]
MHIRVIALITLLLVVQGWCKPPKDIEALEDYNDDAQAEENEDYSQTEDEDESPDTMEEPPQIISQPISNTVRAGTTVTLPCLTENADSFVVIWKKDDQFLYYGPNPMTEEPKRIQRLANNSLVIHNATMTDSSDNYTCSITSRIPVMITHRLHVEPSNDRSPSMMMTTMTTTSMITTTTTAPQMVSTSPSIPYIHVIPSNKIDVKQGETVKFSCIPFPKSQFLQTKMKWYLKNEKLQNSSHIMMNGNDITIFKVKRHDAGMYQCLADNGMKNPPMAAIHLIVQYSPEIVVERDIVHTGDGVESEITCIVHAHPHANVTWSKNQKEIPKGENGKFSQAQNKSKYYLKIMRTNEQDFGDYVCHAKNKFGQASRTITLTGAPSQASIFEAFVADDNNDLVLKWRLESYSPIAQYKLKYRRKGDEQWQEIEPRVKDGDGITYIVEHVIVGLDAGNYEAILEARNSFGWSPPSKPVSFKKENVEKAEAASVGGSAVSIRPFWAFPVSLLVVCAFIKL